METRFYSRADSDGTWSIIDRRTGRNASFAGRELTYIPGDLIASGLFLLNEIETVEKSLPRAGEHAVPPSVRIH